MPTKEGSLLGKYAEKYAIKVNTLRSTSLLLAKLSAYGFDDDSLRWFRSYLSDHQQWVVLDHVYSDWATVMRGVPQGSVLGPLLFHYLHERSS